MKRLAIGGMAELYLASSTGPQGFKRRIVLKKILPQFADNPNFVEMFLSEARIAGQLSHPNLAQVYEISEVDGTYFIAMEYVDGPNLRTLRTKAVQSGKPLSPYLAARIIAYACDGLGYAHEYKDPETGEPLRIIHRDISPDNIVISSTGGVKVLDFGIAKAASQPHLTKTGVVKGKMAYMAPEQMARKPLDHRADIYALGVVLYELLAGARPYEASSELALLHARVTQQPVVPLKERRPDLPDRLCEIVDRALALDRDQRIPTCRALQTELEKFIHQAKEPIGSQEIARLVAELHAEPDWGPIPAAAPATPGNRESLSTTSYPAPDPLAGVRPDETTEPRPPPGPRRREPAARSRTPLLIAAAAVVLVGAGAIALRAVLGDEPAPAPAAPAAPARPEPTPVAAPPVQPPPPAPEKPKPALLTVESITGATIRVGKQGGPTPQTFEVEPGDVKIVVEGPGFSKVDWARGLKAGESRTRQVKPAKVKVRLTSVPEARVQFDGIQLADGPNGDKTPFTISPYEGEHVVVFQCENGKVDRQKLTLLPAASEQRIVGNCGG